MMGRPHSFITDAYGPESATLLQALEVELTLLSREAIPNFHDHIASFEDAGRVLERFRSEEYGHFKQRQANHLILLLSADLTRSIHQSAARLTGAINALLGIEVRWVVQASNFYQDAVYTLLSREVRDRGARELLMRTLSQRFLLDLEGQVSSYHDVTAAISVAFGRLDRHVISTEDFTDLVQGALAIICDLPGDISGFLARANHSGELQIELSQGRFAHEYQRTMDVGAISKHSIEPGGISRRGLCARAWRSGEIEISDAQIVESGTAPWDDVVASLGFRSSAAVPLLDESGRSQALLILHSAWPGFFSTDQVSAFLKHIQHMLSHALRQRMAPPPVTAGELPAYRRMLDEGRMVIHYQPVIDLTDGTLVKVEALARILSADGECISPDRFLPQLRDEDLLILFEQVTQQVCQDIGHMNTHGVATRVAVNFPAQGFDDTRYEAALFKALQTFDVAPGSVQLEVLETHDGDSNETQRKACIRRLIRAGVQMAQDDLGSGYSSLLRLEQYPFNEVKIDQGLVRGALENPERAVEFMLHLTRLAHACSVPVTVEGLENPGMIEAAAILGADWGQGYGIAKPVPLVQLIEWTRDYQYTVEPQSPKTAMGAMAGYLLWDLQLASLSETPEFVSEFVGAKALISHFIEINNLQGGQIEQLLQRKHQLAALNDKDDDAALMVRGQLLKKLADHWIAETCSSNSSTY